MSNRVITAIRRVGARVGTVRAATTALATVFVGIALIAGGIALVGALRQTLITEVAEASRSEALDVASQLESGAPPTIEVAGSDDEQLVQVLGPDNTVMASSSNVAGEPAVAQLQPGESARIVTPSTMTSSLWSPRGCRPRAARARCWWPGR